MGGTPSKADQLIAFSAFAVGIAVMIACIVMFIIAGILRVIGYLRTRVVESRGLESAPLLTPLEI